MSLTGRLMYWLVRAGTARYRPQGVVVRLEKELEAVGQGLEHAAGTGSVGSDPVRHPGAELALEHDGLGAATQDQPQHHHHHDAGDDDLDFTGARGPPVSSQFESNRTHLAGPS